jgi:hypothetical protein
MIRTNFDGTSLVRRVYGQMGVQGTPTIYLKWCKVISLVPERNY